MYEGTERHMNGLTFYQKTPFQGRIPEIQTQSLSTIRQITHQIKETTQQDRLGPDNHKKERIDSFAFPSLLQQTPLFLPTHNPNVRGVYINLSESHQVSYSARSCKNMKLFFFLSFPSPQLKQRKE
jgi:hypothetical protein